MTRSKIATAPADPVRPSLEGVAKSLVDRLYGDKGPAWGTRLTTIEDTIKAIRQVLSEKMLEEAWQRQANTVAQRPADFPCCPKCAKEVERDPAADDCRIHQTDVGEAEWQEPATYGRTCRGLFFPQTKSLGIDRTQWSPLQRQSVRAGTKKPSFAAGSSALLDYLDLQVDVKQVERVTERSGTARCAERAAAVEQYLGLPLAQRKDKPEGVAAPDLALVSVDGWADFGPMVATAAWQLGFFQAPRPAFVGDGSDHVWAVWRHHFSSFVPILDIIHAISYLFAAALAGRPFAEGWPCYLRWMTWVWQGQVEKVSAALAERQSELGSPAKDDGDTPPRVVVSTALGYLQSHKDKMRYAEYRRRGLPIPSSYVEAAVKQFNQRVKGTEKFWTEQGAEALLQLRADYLSPTCVLNEFWQDRQDAATGQNSYAQAA